MVVLNRVGKYMLVSERNIANFLEERSGGRVRTPSVRCSSRCAELHS